MKKLSFLIITLLLATSAFAQTQKGYVKTKGRMVNGQLVPGQGLKGATVSVQGRTTVIVNKEDGEFSFPVPNEQFKLDSVRKKGYRLVDMDACPRTYNCSGNPIYIVMETPDQQLQDQLTAERKIRRNLQKQLQDKEDEIEDLKAQQKISDDEYRKALQKLYQDQENNEQLIKDMAKRYSELDYDQLDEFYRQVSYCIENGELTKADSLLNTKGDVVQQIEEEKQKGEAIQEQKRRIKKAEAVHAANIDELAKRCYSYYENFKAQYQNDTAAYYLELRASLDTTNVDWQNDAGEFIKDYIADYDKAMNYSQRALRQALLQYGDANEKTAVCYNNIGFVNALQGHYTKALEIFNKSLDIRLSLFDENASVLSQTYNNIGYVYDQTGEYERALEYYVKSLKIDILVYGEQHPDVATSYNNIGAVYSNQGKTVKALECYEKGLNIRTATLGEKHPETAQSYNNIGVVYYQLADYTKAMEYYDKALEIRESLLNEKHPDLGVSYYCIGLVCFKQAQYTKAMEYLGKALGIMESTLGDDHPKTFKIKNNIEEVQQKLSESQKK